MGTVASWDARTDRDGLAREAEPARPENQRTARHVPARLLALQRGAGNRAVAGLVAGDGGRALDPGTRAAMERRFGYDFGEVRVHTDVVAARSAHSLGAAAYTAGRHVVFGAGRYAPGTLAGRLLLAHELAHVAQQGGATATGWSVGDQRRSDSVRGGGHEAEADAWAVAAALPAPGLPARVPVTPSGRESVQRKDFTESLIDLLPEASRQLARDMRDSVAESPTHLGEFFEEDVLAAISEHWIRVSAVTLGFIGGEYAVAALGAAPTGISQLVAAILQVIMLGILGYFAAVEVKEAVVEGTHWVELCRAANGNRAQITQASRSFLRMLWHIMMALLAVAGVRAKIRGLAAQRAAVAAGAGRTGAGGASGSGGAGAGGGSGGTVTDIATHPGYRPKFSSPGGAQASGSTPAYEGSLARDLPAPEPTPAAQPEPVQPAPAQPAPAAAGGAKPAGAKPAVAAGAAAGVESARQAEQKDQDRRRDEYPLFWPIILPPPPVARFVRRRGADRDDVLAEEVNNQKWARARRADLRGGALVGHHVVPLMLGGADDLANIKFWNAGVHRRGHACLNNQPQMATPPQPLAPLPVNLLKHPAGTKYFLKGFKDC